MAENEVMVAKTNDVIQQVDMKTITEYMDTTGLTSQLLPNEKAMFINMAKDYGLNPFKREIYCTVYGEGKWRKCSIVTGYEVYLKRAERIGKLNGWNCQVSGSINDGTLAATVTIYRKDWQYPFTHTAYYNECVNKNKEGMPNAIWTKMPIFMTKKVATAQAFRLCFSDEFGGMPYTSDEINGEPIAPPERNITEEGAASVHHEVAENQQVIQPVTQQNQPPQEETPKDFLTRIVRSYRRNLAGQPYDMAMQSLNSGNDEQIRAMSKRVVDYLGRQGIEVA